MSTTPKDYPITGLCVVADPCKCPPGYDLIAYSEDKRDDCDLWKDGIFRARVTRYLCITRIFPLDGGRLNNVMADLVIQNEKEIPPTGYTVVEQTIDTGEKATRKKQICVKMVPRQNTSSAITELIVLSRSKRQPAGYTMAGEINGLVICFKYGNVPPSKSPTTPVIPAAGLDSSQPTSYFRHGVANESSQGSAPTDLPTVPKQTNHVTHHPLSGVPFSINPKYAASGGMSNDRVPEIHYRSLVDIENEYSYPFRLERVAITRQL